MSRSTGSAPGLRPRSGSLLFVIPMICAWHTPLGFADAVKVYRCSGKDGSVEFRQQHCDQGRQQEVRVDTTPTGWMPPRVKPESKRDKRARKPRSKTVSKGGNRTAELKQKQEKECWRTQKRLDKLEWKMRRGYKAGKGPGLRRQRRDHEDYLRKFC